ncbi:MAG: xanthine dehydrogenase family protein molybdopterin-binding subunit [Pseudomonadales bacterium]|nr:xanthine dehydrogenase family protein molybdopterin-binding subunit [Pseudomonadales bacterium]
MKFGVGQSVPRKEDPRLVTGGGEFTDDVNLADQAYMRVLRSPFAHGRIVQLDVEQAAAAEGVLAVYTAKNLTALGSMPCRAVLKDAAGNPAFIPRRALLAEDKVAFVGQAIAVVVAESTAAADDACELIQLDVEDIAANPLPALALDPDTPVIHPEHGSNLCVHYQIGDVSAVNEGLAKAQHVVEVELVNNRMVPSPLETRASVGVYEEGQYLLYNPSQGAVAQKGVLADAILKVDSEAVRVVSLDTGGGFGVRGEVHPEAVICLVAAKALGRPVKYTSTRAEMFLADSHGRDNLTTVTGGFDADGKLQAVRVETIANLGAYCSAVGPFVPTMAGGRIVGTVYRVPHLHHSVRPVFTNTMPVAAYRGAGRPEACYVMERLFEEAALQIGVNSVELRRLNFVTPAEMPYRMPSGVDLTCGEFSETLDRGLDAADWTGFDERQVASNLVGLIRGRGIGYYVESSGGGPEEEAQITLREDGGVDVIVGTYSHGQGHRTTYSQILSEAMGIDFEKINIIQGDTETVLFGGGTGGSRSSQMGGVAVKQAWSGMLEKATDVAAELLQSDHNDVVYAEGNFSSCSNESTVTLAQVASAAQDPQFGGKGLSLTHRYNRGGGFTFPNGCHVAEVEIDPETGVITVARYTAVDDCGRVINPLLAAGQVHGGVVMGIGQAIYEHAVYDDDGQLITGTLMDYAMPRASHMPDIEVSFNEVLDPNNELGVKGIGEGGACGAPPAIVNAVLGALRPLGVTKIDMPLSSESIWRAIQAAK